MKKARAKRILCGLAGLIVVLSATLYWLSHRLSDSAVRLCETAFGNYSFVPSNLTTNEEQDAWIEAKEQEQQRALAQTRVLVRQPGVVAAMKSDLAVNKRDALRYASIAYVLAYNGIDTRENVHRLRIMVDPDPADSFFQRVSTIADPSPTDNTVDNIAGCVFEICDRNPAPDVLQAALTMRADGGTGEIIGDGIDNLLMHHPSELLSAINGQPNAELNVSFQLNAYATGDNRIAPIIKQECHSRDRRISSSAKYIAGYMAHPYYPKKWLEGG